MRTLLSPVRVTFLRNAKKAAHFRELLFYKTGNDLFYQATEAENPLSKPVLMTCTCGRFSASSSVPSLRSLSTLSHFTLRHALPFPFPFVPRKMRSLSALAGDRLSQTDLFR